MKRWAVRRSSESERFVLQVEEQDCRMETEMECETVEKEACTTMREPVCSPTSETVRLRLNTGK